MFSYISLEERDPKQHPLRKLRALVDALLAPMSAEFEAVYFKVGRSSLPTEMLLKALLLVEAIEYSLLYRWFEGNGENSLAAGALLGGCAPPARR